MSEKIENGKVVGFSYILKDNEGRIIDQSSADRPFAYLHGLHQIVPGLERELEGLVEGTKKIIKVLPADGYGDYDANLLFEVPRTGFPEGMDLMPGMEFQANGPEGVMVISIKEIRGEMVLVDGNHPLAGVELNFDISIDSIRNASQQELDHGHVHHGGHDH